MRKLLSIGLVTVLAISLTACANNETTAAQSTAGPSVWTTEQKSYLQEIYKADLAANDVISESVYVEMGKTVCQGFTQGNKADAILALLAATAEQNGLPIGDRQAFGPTITAAAVTYMCPENINNLIK